MTAFAKSKSLLLRLFLALALALSVTGIGGSDRAVAATTLDDPATLDTLYISGTRNYNDAQGVLAIVNQERAAEGLPALAMDNDLLEAAMLRAAETNLDFDHTRPDGTSCFTVSDKASGENIAAGSSTAAGTMSQWMNSQGHRENILRSRFTTIGIGSFTQGGMKFWVQLFGTDTATVTANTSSTASIKLTEAVQAIGGNYPFALSASANTIKSKGSANIGVTVTNPGWNYVTAKIDAKSYKWSSNKTSIATVSAGKVTGVNAGTVKITCASNSNSANKKTVSIKVKAVVKFNANGGKVSPASKAVEKGKAIGKLATPKKSGSKFKGWYTKKSGGKKITAKTKITKNITYYAHWKK